MQPIFIFLNEVLVDEIWTLFKRDGIPIEKVKSATGKVAVKAKFGLGKLLEWLAADITTEASLSGEGTISQKVNYTSFLRALMLPEIIDSIYQETNPSKIALQNLPVGTFIDIECTHLSFLPIPTYSSYMRQVLMSAIDEQKEESTDVTLSLIEKATASQKSLTLNALLYNEHGNTPLGDLWHDLLDEVSNALTMSNDDQFMLVSQVLNADSKVLVVSFVEEKFIKKNLAGFSGNRPIQVFGRTVYSKELENTGLVLGIDAISVALI